MNTGGKRNLLHVVTRVTLLGGGSPAVLVVIDITFPVLRARKVSKQLLRSTTARLEAHIVGLRLVVVASSAFPVLCKGRKEVSPLVEKARAECLTISSLTPLIVMKAVTTPT
jgi:hypothetical protein